MGALPKKWLLAEKRVLPACVPPYLAAQVHTPTEPAHLSWTDWVSRTQHNTSNVWQSTLCRISLTTTSPHSGGMCGGGGGVNQYPSTQPSFTSATHYACNSRSVSSPCGVSTTVLFIPHPTPFWGLAFFLSFVRWKHFGDVYLEEKMLFIQNGFLLVA